MSKEFLTIAIDHGTSNSAVAVMGDDGPHIIQPDPENKVMPSAVYINKQDRMFVGMTAYRAMMAAEENEGTGYTGYKPAIGQDKKYIFSEVNKTMSGPQLGGVVISELLKFVYEVSKQKIQAAVITIPAKFEQSACEGTREAARNAGLKYYPFLQEPVAAALAYGFNNATDRAQWMVFDLGGGTLDVSLVIVRDGKLVVLENGHAGDNRLGGRKFDREIMDFVINELAKEYNIDGFSEQNESYKSSWGRLILAIEKAKIELSKREDALIEIDGELCKDNDGKSIFVEVPISREQFTNMIAADIERAVHVCETLLEANRFKPSDIDGLILVGGPTKIPYIQNMLQERLNIPLCKDIDPMTAVALGAAIYANTLEVPDDIVESNKEPGDEDQFRVKLIYEQHSKIPTYNIDGLVEKPDMSETVYSVEFIRADGGWRSARIPIENNGMFSAELHLQVSQDNKPQRSSFTTNILDANGVVVKSLDEPKIWHPYPEIPNSLPNSLRVAVYGNNTKLLLKNGSRLPTRGRGTFKTVKSLMQGSEEDILNIPIVESVTNLCGIEDDSADCSVHVGTLVIGGNELKEGDLPKGSKVELEIAMNESREITVLAYVPLVDQEFEATFSYESFGVKQNQINERFNSECDRLAYIYELHEMEANSDVDKVLKDIERIKFIESIEKDLKRADNGEEDAGYRAWTRIIELAGTLNHIWNLQAKTRLHHKLESIKNIQGTSISDQTKNVEKELQEIDFALGPAAYKKLEDEIEEIDWDIRIRHCWQLVNYLNSISFASKNNLLKEEMNDDLVKLHHEGRDLVEDVNQKIESRLVTKEDIDKIESFMKTYSNEFPYLQQYVYEYNKAHPQESEFSGIISDIEEDIRG